jgi:hypothetical protein
MLYPIWQPLPRPRHFPEAPKLDRLLDSYFDPAIGRFSLGMMRQNGRDLRKGLFGPKGVRDVPKGEGVRTFYLPRGWTLRLTYDVPPDDWDEPGDVVAEFIPPSGALGGGGKPFSRDQAHKHAARRNASPEAQPVESRPHVLWHSPTRTLGNCIFHPESNHGPLENAKANCG